MVLGQDGFLPTFHITIDPPILQPTSEVKMTMNMYAPNGELLMWHANGDNDILSTEDVCFWSTCVGETSCPWDIDIKVAFTNVVYQQDYFNGVVERTVEIFYRLSAFVEPDDNIFTLSNTTTQILFLNVRAPSAPNVSAVNDLNMIVSTHTEPADVTDGEESDESQLEV